MPGVRVVVLETCRGCAQCQKGVWFVNAIQMQGGQARVSDACRGCGRCVQVCPHQAIVLRVENLDYVQQTIDRLQGLVSLDEINRDGNPTT